MLSCVQLRLRWQTDDDETNKNSKFKQLRTEICSSYHHLLLLIFVLPADWLWSDNMDKNKRPEHVVSSLLHINISFVWAVHPHPPLHWLKHLNTSESWWTWRIFITVSISEDSVRSVTISTCSVNVPHVYLQHESTVLHHMHAEKVASETGQLFIIWTHNKTICSPNTKKL